LQEEASKKSSEHLLFIPILKGSKIMFQHKMQTKTDAMRLFRTTADLLKWSAKNPSVTIVKGNHDARTGTTTWNVPQWDKVRKSFCDAKLDTIKRFGSN